MKEWTTQLGMGEFNGARRIIGNWFADNNDQRMGSLSVKGPIFSGTTVVHDN